MAIRSIIKSKDVWVLFILLLVSPTFILGLFFTEGSPFALPFFKIMAYFLCVYLILISLLGYLFKRPYVTLFFGCHDLCDRSISWLHPYLPICARCMGIYFGILLSIPISYLNLPFWVYLMGAIPLIIDGYIQLKGHLSNTKRRLVTGLLFGPVVVYLFGLYNVVVIFFTDNILEYLFK